MEDVEEKPHICSTCYLVFESKDLFAGHSLLCCSSKPEKGEIFGTVPWQAHEIQQYPEVKNEETTQCSDDISNTKTVISQSDIKIEKGIVCEDVGESKESREKYRELCETKESISFAEESELNIKGEDDVSASDIVTKPTDLVLQKIVLCSFCHTVVEENELIQHLETHKLKQLNENPTKKETDKNNKACSGEERKRVEKLYQCQQCSKCFKSNYHLRRHVKVHTGEKPFSCDLCEKSFAEKSDLTKHRRCTHKIADKNKCNSVGNECQDKTLELKEVKTEHYATESNPQLCNIQNGEPGRM